MRGRLKYPGGSVLVPACVKAVVISLSVGCWACAPCTAQPSAQAMSALAMVSAMKSAVNAGKRTR